MGNTLNLRRFVVVLLLVALFSCLMGCGAGTSPQVPLTRDEPTPSPTPGTTDRISQFNLIIE